MFTLSSEVNGTSLTVEPASIAQFERMLSGHLSLVALGLISDDAGEFPTESLRVDVKVTRRTEGDPSDFDESRFPYYGLPTVDATIAEGYVLRHAADSRDVTLVMLTVPDAGPARETIYVMLTRSVQGEWSVHDHLIMESGEPDSGITPNAGRFTELTLFEQLRHFATS